MTVYDIKQLVRRLPDGFKVNVTIDGNHFVVDYKKLSAEKTLEIKLNRTAISVSSEPIDSELLKQTSTTATINVLEKPNPTLIKKVRDVLFACTLDADRLAVAKCEVVRYFDLEPNEDGEFLVTTESPMDGLNQYLCTPQAIEELGREIAYILNPDGWAGYERYRERILSAIEALEIELLNK